MTWTTRNLLRATLLLSIAVAGLDPAALSGQPAPTTPLPARLADYIATQVRLTPAEQQRLTAGRPVTRLLPADPAKEVAIFGAVWVNAPTSRYLAAIRNIEQFEKGENFLVTKKISSPPRLADFDALTLDRDDIADLRACKVGRCELKVSEAALLRIQQTVDWSKPTAHADAERAIRTFALEYVNGYLEGGNDRLAAYRDSARPTFVAREFAAMIDQMPSLTQYLPDLRRYLLEYPRTTLPRTESFLYWQTTQFGLKPTIRINHLAIVEEPGHVDVVTKMLYPSHYFWTAIELRVLMPDPARGDGFWYASVTRSRSDGLSGFVGSIIRGKVRTEAEKGMLAALTIAKAKLEADP